MIARFIEFEDRNIPKVTQAVPSSPLVALADCFMEALNDAGQMTRQELIDMAVKAGFFSDAESATQGIHPMLTSLVRSALIRELPNGAFAPPTMSQAIKLRRVKWNGLSFYRPFLRRQAVRDWLRSASEGCGAGDAPTSRTPSPFSLV